jgi:hypothetical protein
MILSALLSLRFRNASPPHASEKFKEIWENRMLAASLSNHYSARMRWNVVAPLVLVALGAATSKTYSAEANWAGEYADKKFLNGQAVFQMSLEQGENTVSVWFSAGYNDGHGCAPEATGTGKVDAKGSLKFTFRDSANNSGTGTITRGGEGIIVSLKTARVADPRCLVFYGQSVRLKRVK